MMHFTRGALLRAIKKARQNHTHASEVDFANEGGSVGG
jgi:hypothetical protein